MHRGSIPADWREGPEASMPVERIGREYRSRTGIRWALIAATLVVACSAPRLGWAACRDKVLGNNEAALVDDAAKRLKPMGVQRIVSVGTIAKKDYYRLEGTKARLFFVAPNGNITDFGVVLNQPASPAETDLQIALAAFLASRISGMPETAARTKLSSSMAARTSDGQWTETLGSATAIVTKSPGLSLILIGQIDCS